MATNDQETLIDPTTAGDAKLLAEFKYACDVWMANMSRVAKSEALAYAHKRADPK